MWSSGWLCGVVDGCVEKWMMVSSSGWLCGIEEGVE